MIELLGALRHSILEGILVGLVLGLGIGIGAVLTMYMIVETERLGRQWCQRYALWRGRRHHSR